MGRQICIGCPNTFCHKTARGNDRQNIIKSNKERECLLVPMLRRLLFTENQKMSNSMYSFR
jgi:hypothetical protein